MAQTRRMGKASRRGAANQMRRGFRPTDSAKNRSRPLFGIIRASIAIGRTRLKPGAWGEHSERMQRTKCAEVFALPILRVFPVAATVQPKDKSMPNQAARAQGIRPTPTIECSRLRSVRDFRPDRDGIDEGQMPEPGRQLLRYDGDCDFW